MYFDQYVFNTINDALNTKFDFRKSGLVNEYESLKSTNEDYSVTLEMPGVSTSNVSITTQMGILEINAKSRHGKEYKHSYSLPKRCDESKIVAKLSDGLLEITIPKIESQKSKEIKVISA